MCQLRLVELAGWVTKFVCRGSWLLLGFLQPFAHPPPPCHFSVILPHVAPSLSSVSLLFQPPEGAVSGHCRGCPLLTYHSVKWKIWSCMCVRAVVEGLGDPPSLWGAKTEGFENNCVCGNRWCVYVCTCVVGWTDAGVVVDSVDAGRVVLTVVVFAVVWVYLTTLALETWRAHTAIHTQTECEDVRRWSEPHTVAVQHEMESISQINQLLYFTSHSILL